MGGVPTDVIDLMKRFGKTFNKADVDGILECVTDDFEWRLATGPNAPNGKIVTGRDAVRQVLGTFHVIDSYADSAPLDVRGVDIYTLRDGLIATKDSYWKRIEQELRAG